MTTDDRIEVLGQLGLTGYEARAYLALARSESLSAAEVARAAGLPRQRIYDVLTSLVGAGLAVLRPGRVARYEAAPPSAAIEGLLAVRRQGLAQLESQAGALAEALEPIYQAARSGASGCAAVILAAGSAARFGGAKLRAELDGRPLLQHVLDLAYEARLDPVVVVLGTDSAKLRQACSWRGEHLVVNPDPIAGMSGSVKLGLAQLALSPAQRAFILLGDQPRLSEKQLRTILDAPRDGARPIMVPRYGGQPGNPVLMERSAWRLAQRLAGDSGMSQFFAANPTLVRYVEVEGANPDVDTPADLAALRSAPKN